MEGNVHSAALKRACAAVGLSAVGARLLRVGSNTVYRLKAPIVVRISNDESAGAARAHRAVVVARWLAAAEVPAARALDFRQPVVVKGRAATFWEAVPPDMPRYAATRDIGAVLVRLHDLTAPGCIALPVLDPFGTCARHIAASSWPNGDDRNFLKTELARLATAYGELGFELPQGVIHGDANVGNVLLGQCGKPVMIDLDDFAVGPREWDLIQTAVYYDSFGWHTRREYEEFVRSYGFDVMRWSGYPVLRSIREFLMTVWVVRRAAGSDCAAGEAAKRIAALRTGASRKDWLPCLPRHL